MRVSGGVDIPTLNVAGKTGGERIQAIAAYMTALESHVTGLEQAHEAQETHTDSYNAKACTLSYTDIVTDNMMYSVPASQVLAGLQGGGAAQLEQAIVAMEQQIGLSYQHKGMHKKAANTDRYPAWGLTFNEATKAYAAQFEAARAKLQQPRRLENTVWRAARAWQRTQPSAPT